MKPVAQLAPIARHALEVLALIYPVGMAKSALTERLMETTNSHDAKSTVSMLLESRRIIPDVDGHLNVAPSLLTELRMTPAAALADVNRCECGMPAELDAEKCPDCAGRGANHRLSGWRRRGQGPRPSVVKHRTPTPPPAAPRESAVCPNPLKVAYRTERDALLFLASGLIDTQWPYRCKCGAWHCATRHLYRWQVRVLEALAVDPAAPLDREHYLTPDYQRGVRSA